MSTKKNTALADLAAELYQICMHTTRNNGLDAIAKAQRIVTELAKVEDIDKVRPLEVVQMPNACHCYFAVIKCRAIAEEKEA